MNEFWTTLLGVPAGLLTVWLVLVAALLFAGRRCERPSLNEVLRLLPDLLRLLRRVAADRTVPRGARVRLWLLLAYLLLPIDLIPDFVPVLGYADDAIIVVIALRSVVRLCGRDVLDRHWPGTAAGLAAVGAAAGL